MITPLPGIGAALAEVDLVLVRHARTEPSPGSPAASWRLARGAEQEARQLARDLSRLLPNGSESDLLPSAVSPCRLCEVYTSHEPKAVATGRAICLELGLKAAVAGDLEEHHRATMPMVPQAEWLRTGRRFFARPRALVFGEETAAEAGRRFAAAVRALWTRKAPGAQLIVSHGTVISLLLAEPNALDPFELWSSLAMPEALLVRGSDLRLLARLRPGEQPVPA